VSYNNSQSLPNYSEIIPDNRGLHSASNKTNGNKIGMQLYNLWQIHRHSLNWRIATLEPLYYLGL